MNTRLSALSVAASLALSLGSVAHAQVSADIVKVGLLIDMSGSYSDLAGPGSVIAGRMAVEDFGGKVLGKPIELVVADSQNKADIASTKAREWFDTGNVDAILDLVPTNVALAVMDIAAQKNKIAVVVGSASTPITNEKCTPTSMHWMYDTYSSSIGVGRALARKGNDTWFFITADYAFGKALEKDVSDVVVASGGKVVNAVRHPLNTQDFSSVLLQAQSSKAKVVGLANAGGDAVNAIKQASEFGLTRNQIVAPLLLFISDVHSLGLPASQGLFLTEGFYWDQNEQTRAWSKRFFEKHKRMPTMAQAGVYSAVTHYFKSVKAAGTDSTDAVLKKMRETPVQDVVIPNGKIRQDGRLVHDMLLLQVKKPGESKAPWDYYHVRDVIPGDQAFKPLSQSTCPLVKK
ncbi:ABC transporter substrate-binding protein [Rhizobacter sp. Root1221]|uniref:ABC transporter substrate-binding protein n=1 Tax=Rhizobacter sp. Root1221 TaxID=1736433 RepID=UPI0006F221A8|nr:ABC transporter substrate-binding protein [Rhizobacter sp. Root1221]KQV94053.1 ABC transporter permease [Rhizobacter sp. Root1221]